MNSSQKQVYFTNKGQVCVDVFEKNKVVLYFFSAHWCPACRQFLPEVITKYNQFRQKNYDIEIIYVSCDKTEKDFDDYVAAIPFLALPKSDPLAAELKLKYKINGIPQLIAVDQNKERITKDARVELCKYGVNAYLEWIKD